MQTGDDHLTCVFCVLQMQRLQRFFLHVCICLHCYHVTVSGHPWSGTIGTCARAQQAGIVMKAPWPKDHPLLINFDTASSEHFSHVPLG